MVPVPVLNKESPFSTNSAYNGNPQVLVVIDNSDYTLQSIDAGPDGKVLELLMTVSLLTFTFTKGIVYS